MDALQVARIEDQTQAAATAGRARPGDGSPTARWPRRCATLAGDRRRRTGPVHHARSRCASSLALDDLSLVYRGHLFALVSRAIPAANVPPSRPSWPAARTSGTLFDAVYLNRDLVCLGCHNSDESVTVSPDPALNRHWPVPGRSRPRSTATRRASTPSAPTPPSATTASWPTRPTPSRSVRGAGTPACGSFRIDDLAARPGRRRRQVRQPRRRPPDRVRPRGGARARLRQRSPPTAWSPTTPAPIADPDAAIAYLVAATIVEGVWREVIGTPLTIANYFPRNQAARDDAGGADRRASWPAASRCASS